MFYSLSESYLSNYSTASSDGGGVTRELLVEV